MENEIISKKGNTHSRQYKRNLTKTARVKHTLYVNYAGENKREKVITPSSR